MSSPHARPIKRLLVANRGEIAVRILHAARELPEPIETFTLYTSDDRSHCDLGRPQHAIEIPSASSYLDILLLIEIAQKHSIDAVHAGYGFLSESAEFAYRMWHEAGSLVIGPGWENLARTGDKLQAKQLAQQCGVPVLEAMGQPTSNVDEARAFATQIGFPVMIKAVDGGGGRGIRLVREEHELNNSIQRSIGESPSRTAFVEKAAVDGFHHVEIQIIGDGTGQVRHLWERDCSAQRRFQKVVECAPSLMRDRALVGQVIDSALRMASKIRYQSLGTFEFLVSEQRGEFYFLEVNPRLQVEHTITESISGIDLVQTQLLLAQGHTLHELGLGAEVNASPPPPNAFSIQLRLCAEDPSNGFSLSIGKVTGFTVPSGHGIRVDTHISVSGSPLVVGSNFDNLLAKIIVTAPTWEASVRKAQRVLADSRIDGLKTNISLLRGIVAHSDFMAGKVDTQWLGLNLDTVLQQGENLSKTIHGQNIPDSSQQWLTQSGLPASNLLFRKGDAWSITLESLSKDSQQSDKVAHHLRLTRVLRNEFPASLTAEIEYTTPTSQGAIPYRMQLETTTTAASALVSSSHRRGNPKNPHHIILPLSGKLIEILVTDGEDVVENQVLAFVKQMKMELEVRSPRSGRVKWVYEMENEEEDVAEGMLLLELEPNNGKVEVRGKL
ncbi:ATP-grasp fold subdomain 1 [Penicillium cf. griseofulvum]|uniref:ATP-grasp fold subdomain 1 n=1 Tax=Penicillium cf. griseofulvum TaxID=2972120 RepID=A0A9W9JLK7_9EURO|nr:ATP-grasp fold subdomain 1 [Penicillium cf. griseofulvum]KAJ5441936.1 ATP-grasp fold subdomain 1 [Penicillium cf. griseofulvum]KAJ5451085.1 ATP-grasp fold subdomain 1 [Penicillium cf. griseofulvum]